MPTKYIVMLSFAFTYVVRIHFSTDFVQVPPIACSDTPSPLHLILPVWSPSQDDGTPLPCCLTVLSNAPSSLSFFLANFLRSTFWRNSLSLQLCLSSYLSSPLNFKFPCSLHFLFLEVLVFLFIKLSRYFCWSFFFFFTIACMSSIIVNTFIL